MPKLYGGARRGSRNRKFCAKSGARRVAAEREMRHEAGRLRKNTHNFTPYAQVSCAAAAAGASERI
jgi:hypothetical protein